jgi:hypothetical protein
MGANHGMGDMSPNSSPPRKNLKKILWRILASIPKKIDKVFVPLVKGPLYLVLCNYDFIRLVLVVRFQENWIKIMISQCMELKLIQLLVAYVVLYTIPS